MSGERTAARIPWSDRFAIWRMLWFPYRTHVQVRPGVYGPPTWQWPDVFGKDLR